MTNFSAIVQIRIARPTDKLAEVVSFYNTILGLPVIGRFENHAGYSGVMIGMPDDRFHLEFTHFEAGSPCPAPSQDNLLVLYIESHQEYHSIISRFAEHGYEPVEPENPYWMKNSLTFEDPDGWRVVVYRGRAFDK